MSLLPFYLSKFASMCVMCVADSVLGNVQIEDFSMTISEWKGQERLHKRLSHAIQRLAAAGLGSAELGGLGWGHLPTLPPPSPQGKQRCSSPCLM